MGAEHAQLAEADERLRKMGGDRDKVKVVLEKPVPHVSQDMMAELITTLDEDSQSRFSLLNTGDTIVEAHYTDDGQPSFRLMDHGENVGKISQTYEGEKNWENAWQQFLDSANTLLNYPPPTGWDKTNEELSAELTGLPPAPPENNIVGP